MDTVDTIQDSSNIFNRDAIRQKIVEVEAQLARLSEYRATIDTMSSEDMIVSGLYSVTVP